MCYICGKYVVMRKLSKEERDELKKTLKKKKKEINSLTRELAMIEDKPDDDFTKTKINPLKRKLIKDKLKELGSEVYRIQRKLHTDMLYGGLTPEEIEKKKLKRFVKSRRKKEKHTWASTTKRLFGSKQLPPHHQVNMGKCGNSDFDGTNSTSMHLIYTPMGGQNKKY